MALKRVRNRSGSFSLAVAMSVGILIGSCLMVDFAKAEEGYFVLSRPVRVQYVDLTGHRAMIIPVELNVGDKISPLEYQRLVSQGVLSKADAKFVPRVAAVGAPTGANAPNQTRFSSGKFRKILGFGAVGLVGAGLLSNSGESIAAGVRVKGDAPAAVTLDSSNAGASANDINAEIAEANQASAPSVAAPAKSRAPSRSSQTAR